MILITCMTYMDMVWCDTHWYVHNDVDSPVRTSLIPRLPDLFNTLVNVEKTREFTRERRSPWG